MMYHLFFNRTFNLLLMFIALASFSVFFLSVDFYFLNFLVRKKLYNYLKYKIIQMFYNFMAMNIIIFFHLRLKRILNYLIIKFCLLFQIPDNKVTLLINPTFTIYLFWFDYFLLFPILSIKKQSLFISQTFYNLRHQIDNKMVF